MGMCTNVIGVALVMALLPPAQPAVTIDGALAVTHLEESRDALIAATEGLTDAQWQFRESADRWSAAEIVEHLALSEDFFHELITGRVLKTEKQVEPLPDAEAGDREVVTQLADRSQRFTAPEPLVPTKRFDAPAQALDHFRASRARTLELLRTTPDLRLYVTEAPGGVKRDAVQWFLFVSGHTVRHTAQLQQVKDDARFPRS